MGKILNSRSIKCGRFQNAANISFSPKHRDMLINNGISSASIGKNVIVERMWQVWHQLGGVLIRAIASSSRQELSNIFHGQASDVYTRAPPFQKLLLFVESVSFRINGMIAPRAMPLEAALVSSSSMDGRVEIQKVICQEMRRIVPHIRSSRESASQIKAASALANSMQQDFCQVSSQYDILLSRLANIRKAIQNQEQLTRVAMTLANGMLNIISPISSRLHSAINDKKMKIIVIPISMKKLEVFEDKGRKRMSDEEDCQRRMKSTIQTNQEKPGETKDAKQVDIVISEPVASNDAVVLETVPFLLQRPKLQQNETRDAIQLDDCIFQQVKSRSTRNLRYNAVYDQDIVFQELTDFNEDDFDDFDKIQEDIGNETENYDESQKKEVWFSESEKEDADDGYEW